MDFQSLLREHELSRTQSRMTLLYTLYIAGRPLSEKEIEEKIPREMNKTTIYRNLSTMSQKGIVTRIISPEAIKYKLNAASDGNGKKSDHVHFQCEQCHQVFCLEELKVKDYRLPPGYEKMETQFLIVGICALCNEKDK